MEREKRPYVIFEDPPAGDRRALKKLRTRQELVNAAIRLFAERGFERTTVEEIAEAGRVSPRTFFRYFATKEEVLFSRRDEDLKLLRGELAKRPAGEPPLVSVLETLLQIVREIQSDREFHLFRYRLTTQTPSLEAYGLHLHQGWIRVLVRGLAKRLGVDPREDLRPILIAGCATAAMRAALVPWTESNGELDLVQLTREAFGILQHGLDGDELKSDRVSD